MSELENSIKALEVRGSRVATQAANDGIGTDLVKVLDAARRWASLTSPELTEKAAKRAARIGGGQLHYTDDIEWWSYFAEAVLRSVEEGET